MTDSPQTLFLKQYVQQARRETSALACLLCASTLMATLLGIGAAIAEPVVKLLAVWLLTTVFGCAPSNAHGMVEALAASPEWTTFFSMTVEFIAFFLPFALYAHSVKRYSFDRTFPFCGGEKVRCFPQIFACQALMAMAASILCQTVGGFVAPDVFAGLLTEETVPMTGWGFLVSFLSICVFTPFVEEYVFRGVIFGSLRGYGFGYAAVASSLLFGLAHAEPSSLAYALASGLVFCAVYEMTGHVRYGVWLHALNNIVSFVFTMLLPQYADPALIETANLIYDFVIGVFAVWGFAYILRTLNGKKQQEQDIFRLQKGPEGEKTPDLEKPKVPFRAFFSVGTAFYVLFFLYDWMVLYYYG